jgi:hypothetical protein
MPRPMPEAEAGTRSAASAYTEEVVVASRAFNRQHPRNASGRFVTKRSGRSRAMSTGRADIRRARSEGAAATRARRAGNIGRARRLGQEASESRRAGYRAFERAERRGMYY